MSAPHTPELEFIEAAAALTREQESIYAALAAANKRGLAGSDLDSTTRRFEAVGERVEQLRKRFYPHAAHLTISIGIAVLSSPTGRRMRTVWVERREVPEQ